MDMSYDDSFATSRFLSSSIQSLSSSRQQASQIAKAYRQAAQLFLTRRLPEALSTIEPIITPQVQEAVNGEEQGDIATPAPVAAASKGTRVKVWSFYLTFLNAVIELGPEEGKHAFGSARWKVLVAKCRDGSIWDEVVRVGYGGAEGHVDAEVVINLATLLLTHSPSQKLNQQKMETYLSSTANPSFDVASHMENSLSARRRGSMASGANTPRDLNSKLKLLELYTLHILPRNDEWEYAQEFIGMSELLDDERKEAFQMALHGLKEEKDRAAAREAEIQRQQQEQMEQKQREAEAEVKRQEALREEEERKKREANKVKRAPKVPDKQPSETSKNGSTTSNGRRQIPPTPSRATRPPKKPVAPPPGFYQRASLMVGAMQNVLFNTAQSLSNNPLALLRTLLFMLALALAFGRRDLRERLKRILANVWDSVRRTVGMGVKVSYI